jgi:uncharacterized repeat protein (TIGR03803 family)
MRAVVSIGIFIAFLLRSNGMVAASPIPAQGAMRPAISTPQLSRMPFFRQPYSSKSVKDKLLHSFDPANGTDGSLPVAGLIEINHVFYGTTVSGGKYDEGTVFEVTAGGAESVLYSFNPANGTDGSAPEAGLIDESGVLYGTTSAGGKYGKGTVFEVTAGGAESVLHSFGSGKDGAVPDAGLVDQSGVLYGTTYQGGKNNLGTVFKVTAGGTESVLHSFASGADGAFPYAGLIDVSGVFYGTTNNGGTDNDGTVFEVTAGGAVRVLHSFGSGTDGDFPQASLIHANGVLYGTTSSGGTNSAGTVFELTSGGTESVLYSFNGYPNDGNGPLAGLVYANGVLYGATNNGGPNNDGTVFEVTVGGTESVLHSFNSSNGDGYYPEGGLVFANGILYGTTVYGGKYKDGTVFELTPPS